MGELALRRVFEFSPPHLPTAVLQYCSAEVSYPTPCSAAVFSAAVPQLSSATVLLHSTEATYPPPCSAAVLQYCSAEVSYPHPSQCCRTVLLYCCTAALLHCCTAAYLRCCIVLLIPISASGLRHPRNCKNSAHPKNSNSRVDHIFFNF